MTDPEENTATKRTETPQLTTKIELMTRSGGIAIVLVTAGALLGAGCDGNRPTGLVLKAPLERLPQVIRREHPGLTPGDSLETRLEGEWFEPPQDQPVIQRQTADLSSVAAASQAAYSAFKHADDAWIVASFAEADREDIRGFLSDSAVREGSRHYFSTVTRRLMHGWARYVADSTEYRLVFVTEQTTAPVRRLETFVRENDQWLRTNALRRDHGFNTAWVAFRYGRILPQ